MSISRFFSNYKTSIESRWQYGYIYGQYTDNTVFAMQNSQFTAIVALSVSGISVHGYKYDIRMDLCDYWYGLKRWQQIYGWNGAQDI